MRYKTYNISSGFKKAKRKISIAAMGLVTLAVPAVIALSGGAAHAANTLVVDDNLACPSAVYTTISAAVTAAANGDTIQVCAGTYNELVNVNKQLTLLGAQSGVDARVTRTGLPATEAVVAGSAGSTSFYVTANDVTIDGFTVQDQTNVNQFGAGIVLGAGFAGSHIVNNIIQNNVVGLFLANNPTGNQAVIQYNVFRNNTQPGSSSGHGIYSDQFVAGGPIDDVLIDNNDFVNDNGAVTGTWGIGMSNTDSANPNTNLQVTNNKFNSSSPSSRGMYFYNTDSSAVKANSISNKTNYAIGLFGGNDGIATECNTISNSNRGIYVSDDIAVMNSNITANSNNISGNATAGLEVVTGSYSGGSGSLNAEKNWWGSATGPTIISNPGGTGDMIVDPDGVVDYSPFLLSSQGLPCPTPPTVHPTNKDQCKNGGWQTMTDDNNRPFKNQGDCVSYVATKGKNKANG